MRAITKEALNTIDRLGVPLRERGRALEIIVGEAVASRLTIPPSPVKSTNDFFNTQNKVKVFELLAKVNEIAVIDLDRTCNLIYQIWRIRYALVHRPCDPTVGRLLHFAVMANDNLIPGEYHQLMEEYPQAKLMRSVIEMSKELDVDNGQLPDSTPGYDAEGSNE